MADTIAAYEAKQFHTVGTDIGALLRQILLSDAKRGNSRLPEGSIF